eukprot:CAMPEP_0172527510 /NCGR_PEP_ID=MMETSP1067-20121228/2169_1 /TAXON_ID=265564 ORGANISM="Thalassiosira punctigera, Strain Tpunct2005C2" /NCGR_SAMPLE_ID=MMETSP1067 /ASSEMBLY_ACC=CAM_ASM_000444 /LENGTH=67 /DNA_ID=CAMNT_0013311259 /DNA_START=743 /DNA_END=946 /DNA_ORIENTATION=+
MRYVPIIFCHLWGRDSFQLSLPDAVLDEEPHGTQGAQSRSTVIEAGGCTGAALGHHGEGADDAALCT